MHNCSFMFQDLVPIDPALRDKEHFNISKCHQAMGIIKSFSHFLKRLNRVLAPFEYQVLYCPSNKSTCKCADVDQSRKRANRIAMDKNAVPSHSTYFAALS